MLFNLRQEHLLDYSCPPPDGSVRHDFACLFCSFLTRSTTVTIDIEKAKRLPNISF